MMKNKIVQPSDFKIKRPKHGLIGHRGAAALAPENTLTSFKLAAELNLNWIEFDVRLIADNHLVIFHDDLLERTTNGTGMIEAQTRDQLLSLDAGSWFNPLFQGEKIPFFKEILPTLLNIPLNVNIELKTLENPGSLFLERFAHIFCNTLLAIWPKDLPLPLISSFQWPLLHLVRKTFPAAPLGFLTEECSVSQINQIATFSNSALHCGYQSLSEMLITHANDCGVPLLAYTVNDAQTATNLLNAGVFALFTDNPLPLLS